MDTTVDSVALQGPMAAPGDAQLWAMPIVELAAHIGHAKTRMEMFYDRFQASRFQRYRSAAIKIMLVRDEACRVLQKRTWGVPFAAKGDTPQRLEVFG